MLAMLMMSMTPMAATSLSAKAASMKIVKVNVQGGRLREGPSADYDVITTLKRDQKIFYSGKTKNAFSYVCTADGKKGFIYRGFLSSYGTIRTEQVYYTTGRNVRMYKKASTSASRAATLRQQQYVIVYKKSGSWAYVRTLDGTAGYIPLKHLHKAG